MKGKVAFITADAGGVGKDIAAALVGEGAQVAIGDLDPEVAEAVARDIDPTGRRVIGLGLDVADEAQVEAAITRVVAAFRALDVLVSVVGVPAVALCDDIALLERKRLLAIQLDGAFVATRTALRQMQRQGRGHIVYVGSIPSRAAADLIAPYARLGSSLIALAHAVTRDGAARGVQATAIWPGFTSGSAMEGRPRRAAAIQSATARQVTDAVASLTRPIAPRGAPPDRVSWADAERVRDLAAALLPMGLCTLERVARHLGVDPRTLQRRLARQDTSFGTIVDDLRADEAVRLLRDTDLSLTDVAETLGFSALSAFSRWFRQRFGSSATTWRRAGLVSLRA